MQIAALAIYAAWVIWVALHHEAWFDEIQAWLLARDNSLARLIGYYARYEGTPGLWHAILWMASHGGLPFSAIWVLSCSFAIIGAVVVLWRAPFPLPLRIGLLATYYFGYQYSVLARGYCLDLLFIPVAASLFADRIRRPLPYALAIGVIANINAYSFIFAGLIGLELALRLVIAHKLTEARTLLALAVAGGLGLFAMWTAWQPTDNGFMDQVAPLKLQPVAMALVFFVNALVDRAMPWSTAPASGLDIILGIVLSATFFGLMVRLILAGRDRLLMMTIPAAMIVFAGFVLASSWHGGVLFMAIVFVWWTQWNNPVSQRMRRVLIGALALLEIMQAIQMVNIGCFDILHAYSAGKPAAEAVMDWRQHHPGARIYAFGGQSFETQVWLPRNVYDNYHHGAPDPQFVLWNKSETWHGLPTPDEWTQTLAARPDAVLAAFAWLPKPVQADPEGQACRAGYVLVKQFVAAMPWRGVSTNNTLILFERARSGACAR